VLAAITRGSGSDLSIIVSEVSAPWATDVDSRHTKVTVTGASGDPVTVTISHEGRNILSFADVQPGQPVDFRIFKDFAAGEWSATVTSGGREATARIPVALHWAPMPGGTRTFERCSVVRWYAAPLPDVGGGVPITTDIQNALGELGRATGLSFTEVEDEALADLTYSWSSTGTVWKSGVGGMRTLAEGRRQGYVKLNEQNEWITRPGFEFRDGKPGRGVLILHETSHALGLGHVDDSSQIMNPTPIGEGVSRLGAGDLAGLAWLYHPQECVE
jgi:hypothetical protein